MEIEKFKCPFIDRHDIWLSADNFRLEHWPENTLPIDIESIVELRLGLNIEPEHNLQEELDIDAYLKRDLTGIVVDYKRYMDTRYTNRLRFSFAHEIGHLVLHNNFYSRFPIESLEDWKEFTLNIPDREYGFIEYQANEFAGRLLVPLEDLKRELFNAIVPIETHGLIDYILVDPSAALSRISPSLSRPFGVSDEVIAKRVERENLWPPKVKYIDGEGVKFVR